QKTGEQPFEPLDGDSAVQLAADPAAHQAARQIGQRRQEGELPPKQVHGGGHQTHRKDDAHAGGVQLPLGEAAPAGEDGQEDHAAPAAEEAVGQPRRSAGDPRRPAMFHVIPPFLKDVSGGLREP
ncbi:hypothetical protein AKKGGB_AKKGGB_11930, partial [Dysosmobacter welbionis]